MGVLLAGYMIKASPHAWLAKVLRSCLLLHWVAAPRAAAAAAAVAAVPPLPAYA
jgi:hypothetical protein